MSFLTTIFPRIGYDLSLVKLINLTQQQKIYLRSVNILLLFAFITVSASTVKASDQYETYDDLTLLEFVICKDVVEREPIEVLQSYSMSDERAWSFARISNTGDIRAVTFVWFYEDEVYYELDTRVGTSPNWRTYSSVALQPGVWRVELHNDEGDKLNEVRFHVSE